LAGPAGPAGPSTPATSKLAVALAADRFSVRQKRTLAVRLVITDDASVKVDLRRGRKRVGGITRKVGAGRAVVRLRAPARGRYTLVLSARGGDGQMATDQARLTVTR
jgi:hypothetical protein